MVLGSIFYRHKYRSITYVFVLVPSIKTFDKSKALYRLFQINFLEIVQNILLAKFGFSMLWYWVAYFIVTNIGVLHTIFNIKVLKMKSIKESSGIVPLQSLLTTTQSGELTMLIF